MSATTPASFVEWFKGLPLPTTSGAVGQLESNANGSIVDSYVATLKTAAKAKFPDYAPIDALPHLGSDRQLIQGPSESSASFVGRLKDAWGQWSRAGTACGVLEQLAYYTQSNSAIWVQQNGNEYKLSALPTPGVDPTSLVVQTNAPVLSSVLTSTVFPFRTIPAGNPWFAFDGNTDLCNRFAIIFPTWPFSALTTAFFNASDAAVVTWPFAFGSNVYSIQVGTPFVTDGGGGVVLHADGTTQTTTGATIRASAPFTGYASVVAYASGVNPLNVFTSASLGALKSIISTFRPNSVCTGAFAIQTGGRTWDYFPPGTTWDGGTYPTWDTSTVTQVIGVF